MQAKRDMANEIVETKAIEQVSDSLYKGVSDIIDNARQEVVVYVNKHSDLMFWHIGHYINEDMGYKQYSAYGSKILATLSQRLTARVNVFAEKSLISELFSFSFAVIHFNLVYLHPN